MFTLDHIRKMKEAELRKEVLLPLLQAMQYMDVVEYHGPHEEGKDIVCFWRDKLGYRKNLALVVKAVRLTGQAKSTRGSLPEVLTQVQQCFGKAFIDPVTGEEQIVHECWIVSNQVIT